jgi:uncharacterized protein (UPF0297 family)
MNSSLTFIPSNDDERDWIVESYYEGCQKKKWEQTTKDIKKISSIDYVNELDDSNYAILIISQWNEFNNSQQHVRFALDANPTHQPTSTDARSMLKKVQREGVLMKSDTGKYDLNIQKICEQPFQIKNYARIYSIDGLKKSLVENGPVLMILPVFKDPYVDNSEFWMPTGKRLGGLDVVVTGYDKNGFKIIIPGTQKKIINYPYNNWGMQWETWTILSGCTTQYKTEDQKSGELLDLVKSLIQTPLGKKKKRFFKRNKKINIHHAPEHKPVQSEERLQNLGLIIKEVDEPDSDEPGSDEDVVWK